MNRLEQRFYAYICFILLAFFRKIFVHTMWPNDYLFSGAFKAYTQSNINYTCFFLIGLYFFFLIEILTNSIAKSAK